VTYSEDDKDRFFHAIGQNDRENVALLLREGRVDINATNALGACPLRAAMVCGVSMELFDVLLDFGARLQDDPKKYSVMSQRMKKIDHSVYHNRIRDHEINICR